jgi:hypothetical protein
MVAQMLAAERESVHPLYQNRLRSRRRETVGQAIGAPPDLMESCARSPEPRPAGSRVETLGQVIGAPPDLMESCARSPEPRPAGRRGETLGQAIGARPDLMDRALGHPSHRPPAAAAKPSAKSSAHGPA